MTEPIEKIKNIFDAEVKRHGNDPKACYWKGEVSQWLRFEVMIYHFFGDLIANPKCSVVDVGCGQADFLKFLDDCGFQGQYYGIDVSPEMIRTCKNLANTEFKDMEIPPIFYCIDFMKSDINLDTHDYIFASGIWNMKVWYDNLMAERYARKVIEKMFGVARKGIAYNMLSFLGDWYNEHNHYYSPDVMLCHAFEFGRHRVILRHDYAPHDFTIIIDKENYK